jgi:hypothetical protein
VQHASLHDGVLAEDALHARNECLAAVDHDEEASVEAKPPGHEVGQEVLHDRRLVGVALPDADGDLRACGRDQERHDAAALVEDDAVDHEREGVVDREVGAEQLGQLLLRR